MAIRTAQERLQKFDEIIDYFARDSRRRTTGSVIQRNLYEPDGRRSAAAMLYDGNDDAMIVQNYVNSSGAKHPNFLPGNPAAAAAIQSRTNKEWGMSLAFILDCIHDDDRCWDISNGLSQFGFLVVEVYRHLLIVDCLPDDTALIKMANKAMSANNMFDEVLKWARELKVTHPIINEHHELGNAG